MAQIKTKFISNSAITTAKIADDAVDKSKIAADLAGNGLGQAAGGELDVNVDDSTIEINTDSLRLKDDGVTGAKLAPAVAGSGLTQDGSGNLDVNTGDGIQISSDAVAVDNTVTRADGSVTFSGNQSMGSNKITNLANGTAANDAVNKSQLDAVTVGLSWKNHVRMATAGSIANLSSVTVANPDGQTQGITLIEGDRILVKDTASADGVEAVDAKRNGIYVVGTVTSGSAPLTRTDDMDSASEAESAAVFVDEGTHADEGWVQTADNVTLDTSALTFVKFTGLGQITAGTGLSKSGDTLNVGDVNKGVQVNADDLEVDASEIAGDGLKQNATNSYVLDIEPADFAGSGLEDDGSDNLQINVDSTNSTTKINASSELEGLKRVDEVITLVAGDITAESASLTQTPHNAQVSLSVDGVVQTPGVDFSISGSTLRFGNAADAGLTASDLDPSSGAAALVSGDKLVVSYEYL